MKQAIIIFLLCISTMLDACKKDVQNIKGEWKWQYTTGAGIAGVGTKPSNGKIVSLSLNNDSSYIFYLNNRMSEQSIYGITSANGSNTIHFDTAIAIDKLFLKQDEGIQQNSDTLLIIDYTVEAAPTSVFIKVK